VPLPPAAVTPEIRSCLELMGWDDLAFYRTIDDTEPRHRRRELDAGVLAGMRKVDAWKIQQLTACDSAIATIGVELGLLSSRPSTPDPPIARHHSDRINEETVLAAQAERQSIRAAAARQRQQEAIKDMLKEKAELEVKKARIVEIADNSLARWKDWWKTIVAIYANQASRKEVRAEVMKDVPARLLDEASTDKE